MATKLIADARKLLSHYGERAEILDMLTEFVLTRKF
jgi:hypothetical protein